MPTPVAVAPAPVAASAAPAPGGAKPVTPAPVVAKGGKPGAPPAAPEVAAPAAPDVKFKIKVDGQMVEMTQAEMERYASKGRFSDKVTQEAKETIRRAKAVQQRMEADAAAAKERAKTDTDAWLLEHGIDPDEFAKSRLERKVEEGKMTPEQRRAAELEQENKKLKQAQEAREKEFEAERAKQATTQLQRRIENELVNAAKRAGLPLGDEFFYAVYESFRDAVELEILPIDANGLLPHHADRIIEEAQGRLNTAQKTLRDNALKLKGDALLDFVGKEAVDNIVAARLEQIRSARGVQTSGGNPSSKPAPERPAPRTYISPAELDAQVKNLARKL